MSCFHSIDLSLDNAADTINSLKTFAIGRYLLLKTCAASEVFYFSFCKKSLSFEAEMNLS